MTSDFDRLLSAYISGRRWFAGKGRRFTVSHIHAMPWLSQSPRVRVEVVTVRFDDGAVDSYQVPIAYLDAPAADRDHALIGHVEDDELGAAVAYDAVYLKDASAVLLAAFHDRAGDGTVAFTVVEGADLPDRDTPGTVMTAEQSNTSIAYGEDAILKLFRRISAGFNPDIEIHEALTRKGGEHVAPLLGWIDGAWVDADGERHEGHLGILQQFLRTATDGWALALASVRDLFVEEDLRADEVGGDFAAEAERLGAATASIHADLAELFESGQATSPQLGELTAAMHGRLKAAIGVIPELEEHAGPLRAAYDALGAVGAVVPVQRVHGDLHLGQTLRTVKGWKIIDFEGEPAKPLAERAALDSVWRDIAGMLRSLDYAAASVPGPASSSWALAGRKAFLDGYAGGELTGSDAAVLRAYEADKAVYEVIYEVRNRPDWVSIPLAAIAALSTASVSDDLVKE